MSLLAGVEMKVTSETLGHARSSFTADTYTTVLPEVARAAADAVASVVPLRHGEPTLPTATAEVISFDKSAGQNYGSGTQRPIQD
jgi:hypothetical protein